MRLTVHEFLTLDGVMQGPGGPTEDPSGGFDRGGWIVPYSDDPDFNAIVTSWFDRAGHLLLGRTTYSLMAPYWPQITDPDNPVAAALNTLPKHVVSTSLTEAPWGPSEIIGDDVVERIRTLKELSVPGPGGTPGGGELQVHGSHGLARFLHDAGLVDEYRLLTFPVVVGGGKRLFDEGAAPAGFEVVRTRTTSRGAVYQELAVSALPAAGEFEVGKDGREAVRG